MRLSISHTTRYEFSFPVDHGLQRLRLKPKSSHGQVVREWSMLLEGARHEVEYEDQHHNCTTLVSVEPGVSAMTVTCNGIVDTADNAGIIGRHNGHMPLWAFLTQTPLTEPGPAIRALAKNLRSGNESHLDLLHKTSREVIAAVAYTIGQTDAKTTAEAAMAAGQGVCQDHAHIFISLVRLMGIPARYVSGYLMMNDRIDQEAGHAWAEAFVEDLGWVGFDVSNGICADDRYVRVATGSDYRDAAPVTGVFYGAGESALSVSLAVEQQLSEQ